ncbi:hypothetical protein M407DRAFT_243754, partial [Tulasnella calospora MUT 4182]
MTGNSGPSREPVTQFSCYPSPGTLELGRWKQMLEDEEAEGRSREAQGLHNGDVP